MSAIDEVVKAAEAINEFEYPTALKPGPTFQRWYALNRALANLKGEQQDKGCGTFFQPSGQCPLGKNHAGACQPPDVNESHVKVAIWAYRHFMKHFRGVEEKHTDAELRNSVHVAVMVDAMHIILTEPATPEPAPEPPCPNCGHSAHFGLRCGVQVGDGLDGMSAPTCECLNWESAPERVGLTPCDPRIYGNPVYLRGQDALPDDRRGRKQALHKVGRDGGEMSDQELYREKDVTNPDGTVRVIRNHWWWCREGDPKRAIFYVGKGWRTVWSPQCNRDKRIVDCLDVPFEDACVVNIELAFAPVREAA